MAKFKARVTDFEAEDIRAFYDSSVLRVWHLGGKDRTFRIMKIQRIETDFMGEAKKRPLLTLATEAGKHVELPLELNPTNRKTIQQMYGSKVKDWIGKLITLYTATGIDTPQGPSDAIRVRNQVPKGKGKRHDSTDAAYAARDNEQAIHHELGQRPREPGDDDEPPMGALETDRIQ